MTSPTGSSRLPRRSVRWVLLALAALALLAGPLARPAAAANQVQSFVVDATVARDGLITVKQTITFDGDPPETLSQRIETVENLVGDEQYVETIGTVTATSGDQTLTVARDDASRYTTLTVPTAGLTEPVVMEYTITGAVINGHDGPVVQVRLLQGLSAPVRQFSATVDVPAITYVKCTAGPPNSTSPCAFAAGAAEGNQQPTFRDGPRGQGEVVGVEIGVPVGVVTPNEQISYEWTVGRAFSAKPLQLAIALGLLVLGGIGIFSLHRRAGVDRASGNAVTSIAQFVPIAAGQSEFRVVGDVRPGHVGTVLDERVDPIDVTATLIDLAVRGHLLITELPRASEYAPVDWTLQRTGADTADLRPFETTLLDAIGSGSGDDSAPVRVSELGGRVEPVIGAVQSALYDEMVTLGWFERRPDAIRSRWTQLATAALIGSIVITIGLAAFTTFGLVGLALIVLALALVAVGQEMPARTAKGSALLAGLGALRSQLLVQPTDQMPTGSELHELSEVLPYAVVLGGVDRWLDAIVAADDDPDPDSTDLSWYHGPETWHLSDLPYSLKNFVTTTSGTLFAR